ncbi:MAG: PAS domain S-box protein [Ignavibacteriaceae bacterium]
MHILNDELLNNVTTKADLLNENIFRQAWEYENDGLCIFNSEARIIDVNSSFCTFFNVTPECVINTILGQSNCPPSQFDADIYKIFDLSNISLKTTYSAMIIGGNRKLLNHYLHKPSEEKNNQVYFWIIKDKTDYLTMKETLDAEIEELKITIKSVGDGIITTDLSGIIQHINPEAERLTGWKKQFTINKSLDQVFNIIDESTGLEHKNILKNIINSNAKRQFSNNTLLISRTGIKTPIAFKGNPIKNDTNTIKGVSLVIRDETENHRKKKDLQESEARFSSVFYSSIAGIVLSSLESGLFIEVNDKFLEMTKYDRNEILGHTADEINIWPDSITRKKFVDILLRQKNVQNIKQEFRIKNGEIRIGQISAEIISIGGATFLLSIINDITENINIENELRTSQAQLVTALEIASLGHWEYNVETDVFTFNDHFYKLFRTSVEQVGSYTMSSAQYVHKFVHPDDIGYVAREIKKAIDTEDKNFIDDLEHRIIYADGEIGVIAIRYFVVKDSQGRTIRTYGVNQDITKRKLIEQALESEKEELNVTLRNIHDGVISTNADDNIIFINQAVTEITGWIKEDLIGRSIIDFFETLKTDYNAFAGKSKVSTIFGMNENNQSMTSEALEIESKDGSKKIIYCNSAQIKDTDGLLKGYVYVIRDITEQAKIEGQLQLSQKMEAVGQLAAGIAHEINTPMQYIMDNTLFLKDSFKSLREYIALLDENFVDSNSPQAIKNKRDEIDLNFLLEEIPSAISQTETGIERVSKIVVAMKDFSHPGQKEKVFADINHGIEVTSIISKNEWKYFADLELNFDSYLPPVFCNIDEISQVILNMIINAAHAIQDKMVKTGCNEKGKIIISTTNSNSFATISIIDTGNGIPFEIRERIFDPFFTTKEVGKGTGQGLSIAHNIIVNNHNGTINVESAIGEGTTFTIKLPLINE